MKITILAIGKKHDPKLLAAIEDYSDRLKHYANFKFNLLDVARGRSLSREQVKDLESVLILSQLDTSDVVVLLDELGEEFSSPQLAQKLQNYMNRGTKSLVFIIGGAYGVNNQLRQRADLVWSLSPLVFPHQLVRLVLVEQLYRAHTILAGEKYHHV